MIGWLTCLLVLLLAAPLAAAEDPPITEVLLRLRPEIAAVHTSAVVRSLAVSTGTEESGRLRYRPVQRLALGEQDLEATLDLLRADPRVEYAEPNYPVSALASPNDPALHTLQWGFRRIGGPEALAHPLFPNNGNGVVLAIVDTGVDERHPELAGRLVKESRDIRDHDDLPRDANGHGTHVAAIAAATTDNRIGIAAPFAGDIMAIQVLNNEGSGSIGDVADGIDHARENGALVVNLSLGAREDSETLEDAVEDAEAQGIVLVAAAGNSGEREKFYPASYGEVISVSAWAFSNRELTDFSTYHDQVELTAPGEHIYSAELQGGYHFLSGTSMAAPFVSGTAATVYAALLDDQPGLATSLPRAGRCVREILRKSAEGDYPERGKRTGFGMVRVDLALEEVAGYQCP